MTDIRVEIENKFPEKEELAITFSFIGEDEKEVYKAGIITIQVLAAVGIVKPVCQTFNKASTNNNCAHCGWIKEFHR